MSPDLLVAVVQILQQRDDALSRMPLQALHNIFIVNGSVMRGLRQADTLQNIRATIQALRGRFTEAWSQDPHTAMEHAIHAMVLLAEFYGNNASKPQSARSLIRRLWARQAMRRFTELFRVRCASGNYDEPLQFNWVYRRLRIRYSPTCERWWQGVGLLDVDELDANRLEDPEPGSLYHDTMLCLRASLCCALIVSQRTYFMH